MEFYSITFTCFSLDLVTSYLQGWAGLVMMRTSIVMFKTSCLYFLLQFNQTLHKVEYPFNLSPVYSIKMSTFHENMIYFW